MDMSRFAKARFDVGLVTDEPSMVDFVADEVGLGKPELLRVSRTTTQHRFDRNGSVVKVNVAETLDTEERSGFTELLLATPDIDEPKQLVGPDGVAFTLVPAGWGGVDDMAIRLAVPDVERAVAHFRDALRWDVDGATVRFGPTLVLLEERADAPARVPASTRGWTYLTAQVWDCDLETAAAVAGGARVTREPHTYGEVARFSMVADAFGNHVELSQRASLTGPLPPN
jgi:lactoylglutathione lyase